MFKRIVLSICGVFILAFSFAVLIHVQLLPDLGLRTAFSTKLRVRPANFEAHNEFHPQDQVIRVGPIEIPPHPWAELLNAPFRLQEEIEPLMRRWLAGEKVDLPEWLEIRKSGDESSPWVRVTLQHADGTSYTAWCRLGNLPLHDLMPSLLWFLLKASLLLVGAWVWWKKPDDRSAQQFFLLCLVTVGAYIGGYHWAHLVIQPALMPIFVICAVLLPAVSLHFYLIFPRPKAWLTRYPRLVLTSVYAFPVLFAVLLVSLYAWNYNGWLRWQGGESLEGDLGPELLRPTIYTYFAVAAFLYLGSVSALVHSYVTVPDWTERNQVKSILLGAVLSLFPIGYSLYLAIWDQSSFAAGGATWPMFAASAILTAAYAVSITRYRLMELDKLISSSMDYFVASFLAAVLYYAVVFVGTLLFNRYVTSPSFVEAVTVSTTALLMLLLLDQARWRVKKFLDRRFTKQKTQLDRTLQRMGQAIEQLVEPPVLAQKFMQATTELLGIAQGAVFLRQGDPATYRLAGFQGAAPVLGELPPGSPLIDALQDGKSILARPRPYEPMSAAQKQLRNLGGEFAQPIVHEDRVLGFLILGPKDSSYRVEDVELLAAFASIAAMALESAEGHRTIEQLNLELREKVQKISEQQRRILALQTQLHRQKAAPPSSPTPPNGKSSDPAVNEVPALASSLTQPGGMVGSSLEVQQLLGMARKVAATDAAVLIRGESGTGKELLSRAIHEISPRATKPFVKVHCAALSTSLLESELFGHVRGAFTGAHKDKVGRFEMANGGTLFLDEIGDISLEVQTKLLRVLQERTFERVGSSEPIQVDVRIITATHQHLENLIKTGRFREDLYYRLNVFPVLMPPLRQRVDDIHELAMHFMRQSALRCKKELTGIDDDALAMLRSFPWPGNIRQLENVIERAVVIAEGNTIGLQELPAEVFQENSDDLESSGFLAADIKEDRVARPLSPQRRERLRLAREQLVRIMAESNGNKAEAARALGIARSTLVSRLKKFGLV